MSLAASSSPSLPTRPGTSPYGQYGCDSPWSLVEQTFRAAKAIVPNPDFVLVTGDSMRHHGHTIPVANEQKLDALEDILRNVTTLLEQVRSDTPRFWVLFDREVGC